MSEKGVYTVGYTDVEKGRKQLKAALFPNGIPRLWCPLLTHYDGEGHLDRERMRMHILHLKDSVTTFLAPGSTGDGWEMEDPKRDELVDFLLKECRKHSLWLMLGVLKTGRGEAREVIADTINRIFGRDFHPEWKDLFENRICGFTVTPPRGRDLGQDGIRRELEAVLDPGYPVALYQLPQVTENEMTPDTVADLAARYPNFYLFKDTSGRDRVADSDRDLHSVFLVRGAEGDYDRWLKAVGGIYDGFLLSTANCFAHELEMIIDHCQAGRINKAHNLSSRLSAAVEEVFSAVEDLEFGNPFTNANKAFDHHFAYGPRAESVPPPMTHSGNRIPREVIQLAGAVLSEQGFESGAGYLNR